MDILTHTLSGAAVGVVLSGFSKRGVMNRIKIVLISAFAGAIPDIDAISLWSGFDSTIGNLFNLSHSGREIYSAHFWYSHHGFMHSISAALLFAIVGGAISYLICSRMRYGSNLRSGFKSDRLALLGFISGFVIHLLEDMPTPASSWGGVNLFWPSSQYIGGFGDIWWWNNYDIFLIILGVTILNLGLLLVQRFVTIDMKKITVIVLLLGSSLVIYQIKSRSYDFSYRGDSTNYKESEIKSKEIQREILGETLFQIMEDIDKSLPVYF